MMRQRLDKGVLDVGSPFHRRLASRCSPHSAAALYD
eukprot:gene50374-57518_t